MKHMSGNLSKLQQFIQAISASGWRIRLQLLNREIPESWSRFFISPSPGYVEKLRLAGTTA